MTNMMTINGIQAVIAYDPDIEMFRGDFVGLNGGADFYAKDIEGLKREGELSLKVFYEFCAERGIEPRKQYTGEFVLHLDPKVQEAAEIAATVHGQSLSRWASETLCRAALEAA